MNSYDIVVVGGGMVGAATAIGFAKQGLNVAVIEGFCSKAYDDSQAMDIRVSAIFSGFSWFAWRAGCMLIAAMRVCSYKRLETWEHPECRTRLMPHLLIYLV